MSDEFRRKRKLIKRRNMNWLYGWGTWIRTKINRVRALNLWLQHPTAATVARQATTSSVSASGAGGETANVSPLKAEEPEEVRRIDEDLARLTEPGLAAELAPLGCGLGKVAGDDVVPDLVPFGTPAGLRRRRSPRDRRRAATRQDYYA